MKSIFVDDPDFDKGLEDHRYYWEDQHYEISKDRAIEEMSELTKILLKERRGQVERHGIPVSDLIEGEIADVMLCLEYICRHRGISWEKIVNLTAAKSRRVSKKLHGKRAKQVENTATK